MKDNKVNWELSGDSSNPTIALIAPSNGFGDEEGQEVIKNRINKLKEKGFYVMVPKYDDGNLLVESEVEGRKSFGRLFKSVTPAVSIDNCVAQIKDSIRNGWNMLPLMGGNGFQRIIPILVDYYQENPTEKNMNVKIFGFSNSTFATILNSYDICHFVATPFSSVFMRDGFESEASQLELIMKNQQVAPYPRRVLVDDEGKLAKINLTKHYPINSGNLRQDCDETSKLQLNIAPGENWSLGLEGFIQLPGNILAVNYFESLSKFLEKHQHNLPQFIEIGNFVTRLDGDDGYQNLRHDDCGKIILDEKNVSRILAKEESLRFELKKSIDMKKELEEKQDRDFGQQHSLTILSLIDEKIIGKAIGGDPLTQDDIICLIQSQNNAIDKIMSDITQVVQRFKVPLVHNSRFGHCANMSVVNGGLNKVQLQGNNLMMEMVLEPTLSIADGAKVTKVQDFEHSVQNSI